MTRTESRPLRRDVQDAAVAAAGLASSRWRALGTSAQVVVTDPGRLGTAILVVRALLDEIDLAASRFRRDSELSEVNHRAGEWVQVSPLLLEAVRVALDAAAATDGLVDPTVGASLVRLGYDRTFRLVPPTGPAVDLRVAAVPGWRRVGIDEEKRRVCIPRDSMLDLGATAKGLAADLAAAAVVQATGCGVLVNLGGDIAVAGTPPTGGWPVSVGDTSDPDAAGDDGPVQTVALRSGGLATSSTAARRWHRGGSLIHHILDPHSGLPAASCWRTVSVAGASCVDANVASTAAIVAGDWAVGWLTERGHPARLVSANGDVVTVGGWPA